MNFKIKNITSTPVYFPIYQPSAEPSSLNAYIPASSTVDLSADGNATKLDIFNSLPDIEVKIQEDKFVLNVHGSDLTKSASIDKIGDIYNTLLNPEKTIQWTENGRLSDNAFLHNGVLEGGNHNGMILDRIYEVESVGWCQDHDDQHGGHFVFMNNSDQETIGSIAIPSDGHGVEVSGTDFTAFSLPKNKRVGVQWQGTQIKDVTLNVTLREV